MPQSPRRHAVTLSLRSTITAVLLTALRLYRLFLSPLLGPSCRFFPSCSVYAAQAITTLGPMRGSWLAARRLCRCHPFSEGGYDPPPAPPVSKPDGLS